MLDFGALPPEVNSGRMYAGPGSGPMMAAASAWDALAAELGTGASGYGSVISELTSSPWVGPASTTMLSAVTPYVSWLSAVATQAEETANQARAAAAAYEAAFMLTVPPPVIAANRALLMALVATNFFGQNTPAIMATEAQYMEMWAQDAAAMYGYADTSAVASQLTPIDPPPNTTTPDPAAGQAAAVAQAAAQPAGTAVQTVTSVPNAAALVLAAAPDPMAAAAADPPTLGSIFLDFVNFVTTGLPSGTLFFPNFNTLFLKLFSGFGLYQPAGIASFIMSIAQQFVNPTAAAPSAAAAAAPAAAEAVAVPGPVIVHALPGAIGNLGLTPLRSVTMSLGVAQRIGGLSVPGSWGRPADLLGGVEIQTNLNGAKMNGLFRGVPLAGLGGGQRSGASYHGVRYGFRYPVVTHPPSAG